MAAPSPVWVMGRDSQPVKAEYQYQDREFDNQQDVTGSKAALPERK